MGIFKRDGWQLAYIRKTYSADADEHEAGMGQGESTVPDCCEVLICTMII
jgi:hypothetical protein